MKKQTARALILKTLFKKPRQTPQQLIDSTGRAKSNVYSALAVLNKQGLVTKEGKEYSLRSPVKTTAPAPKVMKRTATEGWVNLSEVQSKVIEAKTQRIEQLINDLIDKDKEILKLKIDILDQAAVVNYLEKKLEKAKGEQCES
jgi:DNA-binding MarR family transcriptional regulator